MEAEGQHGMRDKIYRASRSHMHGKLCFEYSRIGRERRQCTPPNRGMIVAGVVDAVTREEIEEAPPIFGLQLGAVATPVANVHLQRVEQTHPLRIYVFLILRRRNPNCFLKCQLRDPLP
jgi:hypothetical protein